MHFYNIQVSYIAELVLFSNAKFKKKKVKPNVAINSTPTVG